MTTEDQQKELLLTFIVDLLQEEFGEAVFTMDEEPIKEFVRKVLTLSSPEAIEFFRARGFVVTGRTEDGGFSIERAKFQ